MIAKLRRAIQDRPNVINVYQTAFLLGRSLYGVSQYPGAIDVLSVQMTVDPRDHKSRQLRGDSYYRVGRIDEALKDFEDNIRQVPDNAEYASDLKTLQTRIANGACTRDPKNPGGVWVCKDG